MLVPTSAPTLILPYQHLILSPHRMMKQRKYYYSTVDQLGIAAKLHDNCYRRYLVHHHHHRHLRRHCCCLGELLRRPPEYNQNRNYDLGRSMIRQLGIWCPFWPMPVPNYLPSTGRVLNSQNWTRFLEESVVRTGLGDH